MSSVSYRRRGEWLEHCLLGSKIFDGESGAMAMNHLRQAGQLLREPMESVQRSREHDDDGAFVLLSG